MKNLQKMREAAGLSREALAARMGVSAATIRRWEVTGRVPYKASEIMLRSILEKRKTTGQKEELEQKLEEALKVGPGMTTCCGADIELERGEWWRCEKCGKLVWPNGRIFGEK